MKNPLSDIYSKQVLLNEEKAPVVKGAKELDSKIGKAGLVKDQGPEKTKKDLETPHEDKKHSDGPNAKVAKESSEPFEGAFERLFKATITENEMEPTMGDMEVEPKDDVPVDSDEMVDEIEGTEEEESDLISDIQNVMSQLQGILDKLSEEGSEEDMEEGDMEDKVEEEMDQENSDEGDEEPYEESVSVEDKGHALHNMKAGHEMISKKNMKVSGTLKTSTGAAHKGEFKDSPEPKELGDKKKGLQGKSGMKVHSSVTTGEFFK